MSRVFCSSDWHGCADPAMKVFDYLKPDDTLYFIGDAIDRGNDGIKLMNKLLTDNRVVYLKGNHEEFMEKSLPLLIEGRTDNMSDSWLYQNGGYCTYNTIKHCSDESKMWYVNKIRQMPLEAKYTSPKGHTVIIEHAGYSPFDMPHRTHEPLWDRSHFYDNWDSNFNRNGLDPDKTFLVHGHTPVQYLKFMYGYKDQGPKSKEELKIQYSWDDPSIHYMPEIIRYCGGHKFDIDMCTIVSKRIALLDLDTFEEIYIDE